MEVRKWEGGPQELLRSSIENGSLHMYTCRSPKHPTSFTVFARLHQSDCGLLPSEKHTRDEISANAAVGTAASSSLSRSTVQYAHAEKITAAGEGSPTSYLSREFSLAIHDNITRHETAIPNRLCNPMKNAAHFMAPRGTLTRNRRRPPLNCQYLISDMLLHTNLSMLSD